MDLQDIYETLAPQSIHIEQGDVIDEYEAAMTMLTEHFNPTRAAGNPRQRGKENREIPRDKTSPVHPQETEAEIMSDSDELKSYTKNNEPEEANISESENREPEPDISESENREPESDISESENREPESEISDSGNNPESEISESENDPKSDISDRENDPESEICDSENNPESEISESENDPESEISESENDPESEISDSENDPESEISDSENNPESEISESENDPESEISKSENDPESEVSDSENDPESEISDSENNPESEISESENDPESHISDSENDPESEISASENKPRASGSKQRQPDKPVEIHTSFAIIQTEESERQVFDDDDDDEYRVEFRKSNCQRRRLNDHVEIHAPITPSPAMTQSEKSLKSDPQDNGRLSSDCQSIDETVNVSINEHADSNELNSNSCLDVIATRNHYRKVYTDIKRDTWIPPAKSVTDNGPQFVSQEFKDFLRDAGIDHRRVTPYHPEANAAVERFNATLVSAIRKAMEDGKDWKDALPTFLLTYRTTPHPATKSTPSRLMFNRDLRTKMSNIREPRVTIEFKKAAEEDDKYKDKMKTRSKSGSKSKSDINVGDHVVIRQPHINKFSTRYYDTNPWIVIAKKGGSVKIQRGKYITMRYSSQLRKIPTTLHATQKRAR